MALKALRGLAPTLSVGHVAPATASAENSLITDIRAPVRGELIASPSNVERSNILPKALVDERPTSSRLLLSAGLNDLQPFVISRRLGRSEHRLARLSYAAPPRPVDGGPSLESPAALYSSRAESQSLPEGGAVALTSLTTSRPAWNVNQSYDGPKPEVCIVDDDVSILSAIGRLLTIENFIPRPYDCGEALLNDRAGAEKASCIILDLSMPPMSGAEVQARLRKMAIKTPILFLSGTADIGMAVAAMRDGAADFVEKPFSNDDLILRLRRAIDDNADSVSQSRRGDALERLVGLTPREHEVLALVATGLTSKEIARCLGCSHRTVEIHRHRIMEKSAAESLADLIRLHIASEQPDT